MVFVRKVKTASGATAVQLAERREGRDKVIEHLGSAHTPAELTALLEAARAKVHPGQGMLDLAVNAAGLGQSVITGKRSALLWHVLTWAYADLGFTALGDDAFAQLVLARIVEPTSKASAVRVLREIGIEHASLRTLFRALGRSQQRKYRDTIASACFTHAATSGDLSLVMYDATTLYFEAEGEDALRKAGYSKERHVDPQIVVGLLVDRAGFPLEIGCFEGNKAETKTLIPIVTAFMARHNVADLVIVADAGMLSAANLKELDAAGLRFIVGSRQSKAPADLAAHFAWHGDAFTDGQTIDTITPRHQGSRRDASKCAEPVWNPTEYPLDWRAIWAYSAKRAVRDGRTLTAQENRARAVIAGEKAARAPRFVKTSKGQRTLDEKALARARSLAGLKGYVCNIPAGQTTAEEIIRNYHDLWHVEASFRMSKTDLRARPIFHHTREAIEAHLTVVFAALAVSRHLQHRTGMSIKKIVHTLRPIQQITLSIGAHPHTATDPLTDPARQILTAIGANDETH